MYAGEIPQPVPKAVLSLLERVCLAEKGLSVCEYLV